MKDFVREYGKIAAAFSAGAFLLSLLVGLLARNPFGVVIFRALLLAVVFALLGGGLKFAIKTYLPELVPGGDAAAGPAKAPPDDGKGSTVDIVLPAESIAEQHRYREAPEQPVTRSSASQEMAGGSASSETRPSSAAAGAGEDIEPLAEGAAPSGEAEALGDLAEELAEELPRAGETPGAPADARAAADANGARGGNGEEPRQGAADSRRSRQDLTTELDTLPDITNLEIATEEGSGAPGSRPGKRLGEGTPEDAVRDAVSGQDPATLAKAIRTVLKKDEKG